MLLFSSNLTATSKNTIAKTISYVNASNPTGVFNGIKLGVKITNPKAAADKFVNNPDKTRDNDLFSRKLCIKDNLLCCTLSVNND